MIVGIHQPAYLPWLGYFDRISNVDLFIYLDTVQFQKGSFQNRNKILGPKGPMWLTVPVETAGKLDTNFLQETRCDNTQNWNVKHLGSIRAAYGRANNFADVMPQLMPFYTNKYDHLSDLCWDMLAEFNRMLGIRTEIVRASQLGDVEGKKGDLVRDLCLKVGADGYLSGSQGRGYLDLASFAKAGIKVKFQNFRPTPYPQSTNDFVPAMGVVDYLFNVSRPERMFASIPRPSESFWGDLHLEE